VELEDMTILFDTGGEPEVLVGNINALGVNPMDIDCIVISHEHWDHIGGIHSILDVNDEVTVYLPACFTREFKAGVRAKAEVIETDNATMICDSVCTTRVLHERVSEQALMIETCEGIILLTGCSHPGIDNLVQDTVDLTGEDVYLVMGGYHLGDASEHTLNLIIHSMEENGVMKVAPSHCTGDESIDAFEEAWGENYLRVGVGFRMDF
jgi:7,8-dihydropterin-6-yl-methyl-4-(beta-D-ribofuranosyl)aminobenzene 5'-phosphate synthase